jgi:UDP-N-acetylglucosamine:LPS N-acetylglucosamine transferase
MVGNGRSEGGPARVLLLTAAMGEGHNAAARAIADRIARHWPTAEVRTLDVIALLAPGMSRLAQAVYRLALGRAPAVYQLFYDLLRRHPWFAWGSKRFVAAWCGWRLWPRLRRFDPDAVICTHPYGAAAMDRLRRVRRVAVTTAIFVTDFAPHPFWVFSQIDLTFVMHELSAREARRIGPRGQVLVAAPPVLPAFRPFGPAEQRAARQALALRPDALVVLVTAGGWGVGRLAEAVAALLRPRPAGGAGADSAGPGTPLPLQVVAVCGHNQALRQRLQALGEPRERLVPLGFTTRMPELMAAADVVVTNAGGITALEALASARPLLLFDPIPGHGRANAAMMAAAGLALVCQGEAELRAGVARLAGGAGGGSAVAAAAAGDATAVALRREEPQRLAPRDLAEDLALLARTAPLSPPPPSRAVRRAARALVTGTAAALLLFQGSWVAGTNLAPAARGSPKDSGAVVVAVAGSLPPATLRALGATALRDRLPVAFFVEGKDVAADHAELARLAHLGFEIEAGTWRAQRDPTIAPGAIRAEFDRTVAALWHQARLQPAYVAEPCGRFSLLAAAVTDRLHIRRVVFGERLVVSGGHPPPRPVLAPGRIVALLLAPSASAAEAASAIDAIAAAAKQRGLHVVTLARMDQFGHRPDRDRDDVPDALEIA